MRVIYAVTLAGCILAGSALLVKHAAQRTSTYSIQDLGTLGGKTSVAYAINNNGFVVGQAENDVGANRAFLWLHGKMRDLGGIVDPFTKEPNSSAESTATSINDQGKIVGDADTGYGNVNGDPRGVYHAVLWHDGTLNDLGTLSGYSDSTATKINSAGVIFGQAILQENGPSTHHYKARAFLYKSQNMQPCYTTSYCSDINSQGQVVSWQRRRGRVQVLITEHQRTRVLGPLPVGCYVEKLVISTAGRIAMTMSKGDGESDPSGFGVSPSQSVVWQNNEWQGLAGLPSQPETLVNGINVSGQIVGQARANVGDIASSQPITTAIMWKNGKAEDLNKAIPSGSGWKLHNATGINDHGQIVGFGSTGGQDHAFLLTPLRESSAR